MWLLEQQAFRDFQAAFDTEISAEQITAFEIRAADGSPLGGAKIVGREGVIPIEGVLTEKPNFFARYLGGGNTVYSHISEAVRAFDADPAVDSIAFEIGNSPGGNIAGLFATVDVIRNARKPTVARVKSMAASATYAIASAADKIHAVDKSTMVGSVGIIQSFSVDDKEIEVSSTKAPKKKPDVRTEEGQAAVREVLDRVHTLFADAIAKGRGITADVVDADFGQGAIVLASDALKKGMIDGIGNKKTAAKPVQASSKTTEAGKMDSRTLRMEHPALYAEVLELGVAQERDRVVAHVKMGEASGDTKTMMQAIKDGSGLTMSLQADYQAAAMRRHDIQAREVENVEVEATPSGDGTGSTGKDAEDQVADIVARSMGLDDLDEDGDFVEVL